MDYTITYYSEAVQNDILSLPDTLAARYIVLTRRMIALGPNLGEPHTKAFTDNTPASEKTVALSRMKEVKHAHS
jgi:hypothetical protein